MRKTRNNHIKSHRTLLTLVLMFSFLVIQQGKASGAGTEAHTQAPACLLDAESIELAWRDILEEHGEEITTSAWIGGVSGDPWYSQNANAEMPTASAIKTAYLVELFAAYADRLDDPLPELGAILDDDDHPVLAPFSEDRRQDIRRELRSASLRKLGEVMTGHARASNHVYNAAANLTTALLGGPEALTKRIQSRDPAFQSIFARRYMLADRQETGDNTASAEALAAVLQRLAFRQLAEVDNETIEAIREAMVQAELPEGGRAYIKGGSLTSDPLTRVASGWREFPDGTTVVYVVMTSQANPGKSPRSEASEHLQLTTQKLTSCLLDEQHEALPEKFPSLNNR